MELLTLRKPLLEPGTNNSNSPSLDGLFTITNRASGRVITCPDNVKTPGGNWAAVQGGKSCKKNEKWDFKLLNGGSVPTR